VRFWVTQLTQLFSSLLSWYQALYSVHKVMKVREIKSIFTSEQKQAVFLLRNDSTLLKEQVIEKLKVLDPSLTLTEPVQNRHVGYAQSPYECFWCGSTIQLGEMVLYYGEPPAPARWQEFGEFFTVVDVPHKSVILHYDCALTLKLYKDNAANQVLWANLKQRYEAGQQIASLLLQDESGVQSSPRETKLGSLPQDDNVETADIIVFLQTLDTLSRELNGEEKKDGITKLVTEVQNSSLPLQEFMGPILERECTNPLSLADIVIGLSEEDNHDARVIEIARQALKSLVKRLNWNFSLSVTNMTEKLAELEPTVLLKLKGILEKALGKNDHPIIRILDTRLEACG